MGKMNALSLEAEESLWMQHEEEQRQVLRDEGQTEVCKMIVYELERKYQSAVVLNKPTDVRPTALREAIQLVKQYL
jgi:hypothetical protein